jgi:YbbR domain-containing protein
MQNAYLSRLFRKIFLDDWMMKLVALVITLALWFGVTGLRAPKTERKRNIPLNLRVSNDIEVVNSPVTEVDIVVTGDKNKVDSLNLNSSLVVSIDLSDVQAGVRTVNLTPDNVSVELPQGVKLEEIQPSKIAVELETVEEKEINVRAETEGSVAEGFEVYGQTVLPQKARLRAPSSFIKSLEFVSTEKINLDNRRADFTAQQVSLNIANPKAKLLDTVVDVQFRIGEKRIERLFLVPVQTDKGLKKATVILYGARSLLEGLMLENLHVELAKTDTGESEPRLILPAEIDGKVEVKKLKINP